MKTVAAREAKNHFGSLLDDARREPILVERNGRRAAVVLSPEEYDRLVEAEDAIWAARAMEVIERGEFLSPEESMKRLEGFIANAQD